jgi:hypothetical protein
MYKGLLRTLTYMYQFITLGRGTLSQEELASGANWASTMVRTAPQVLEPETGDKPEEIKLDLAQAEIVEQHIEEMVVWMTHLEIV